MTSAHEDLTQRLRAALDTLPVPERPWPSVKEQITRRRNRHRTAAAVTGAALAVTVIAVVLAVVLATRTSTPSRQIAPPTSLPISVAGPVAAGPVVHSLRQPGALVASSAGQLYIADDGRNQILQLLPGGRFRVLAGNGRKGFSGDGGPAAAASLNDPGGMTLAPDGTLYFADTGNNRIRAVSRSGIITTIAGTGHLGTWVPSGTPGRKASLESPADVVTGPGGTLYIADTGADEILKTTAGGRLILVAGTRAPYGGIYGTGRRATQASPDSPDGLAFDQSGDLFIAGFATKTLLMITPGGIMKLPGGTDGFYPRGDGGLVTAPDGSVLAMNTRQVDKVTTHGLQALYNLPGRPAVRIRGFTPDGIAVGADGTIYLDTWKGNGYAFKTALIEIKPDGTAYAIWAG